MRYLNHLKKKKMNKEIKLKYKQICEANDVLIKTCDNILPMGFIVLKNKQLKLFSPIFKNHEEKLMLRELLKKFLINHEMLGYILIFDTKMTKMYIDKTPIVHNAIIRNLYTPKEKISEAVIYKDKKIIEKMKLPSERKDVNDEWDLWNDGSGIDDSEEKNKEYNKFREENKELYEND